jgi:ankyrin repeat protein
MYFTCVRRALSFLLTLIIAAVTQTALSAQSPNVITAVRNGDVRQVNDMLKTPGHASVRDAHGNTALHWAALAGNQRLVARLLEAGFDPNATNTALATPLHYGVSNEQVVILLLKAGANPKARSAASGTPLHSAAALAESFAVAKRLLDAGAEVDLARAPQAPFEPRDTPLSLAAFAGDERTVKLLLDRGASPGLAAMPPGANAPFSPVAAAAFAGRERILRLLVERGGSVNCDDGFAGHALNVALYAGHRHLAPYLLARPELDLHRKSTFGEAVPPMVWAAYDETGDPAVARTLLARGIDINEPSSAGSTALSWASKRGATPLFALLRAEAAKMDPDVKKPKVLPQNTIPPDASGRERMLRDSAQRAVTLLQRSSDAFLENGFAKMTGCVSCHQQTLPAVTFALARERGFQVDASSLARQLIVQQSGWSKTRDRAYELHAPQPAPAAVLGYGLDGLHALRYEHDDLTDAMSYYLAQTQSADGSWPDFDFRPPMESGAVVGTALTVKVLQLYPPSVSAVTVQERVAKARRWLERAKPINLSQQVFRYHGLSWAGAKPGELRRETSDLLAQQRVDGGWAPLPGLESDSWATGHTLVALHQAGGLATSNPAYRRGVEFLLRTQFADGSWWVKSRTWPFQPHFDSEFPHGKDQWISAGGTAWAAMALLLTLEPTRPAAKFPTGQQLIASITSAPTSVSATNDAKPNSAAARRVEFNRDIRPILEHSCVGCHSGERPKGEYNLASHETAMKGGQSGDAPIVAGQAERSSLLRFVRDQVEDLEMPPLAKRDRYPALTKEQTTLLGSWIAEGALWPAGATLTAPEK